MGENLQLPAGRGIPTELFGMPARGGGIGIVAAQLAYCCRDGSRTAIFGQDTRCGFGHHLGCTPQRRGDYGIGASHGLQQHVRHAFAAGSEHQCVGRVVVLTQLRLRKIADQANMEEGSADRYFQEGETDGRKLVPEGIEARVPYKGPVSDTLYQLVGGLRSGMGYCGAASIAELQERARFIRVTLGGLRESHPHDVKITREAPNYSA